MSARVTSARVELAFRPEQDRVELAFRPAFTPLSKTEALAPEMSSAKADSRNRNLHEDAALMGGSTWEVEL